MTSTHRRSDRLVSVLAALALVAGVIAVGPIQRALGLTNVTFDVTEDRDLADINPGDGLCEAYDGSCSLRAAVQEHNALADVGETTVNLPGWDFSVDSTLVVNPVQERTLTLAGIALGNTTISANRGRYDATTGRFTIFNSPARRTMEVAGGSLTLQDLSIQSGHALNQPGADGSARGGAGLLAGPGSDTVTIERVLFRDNISDLDGGAIAFHGTGDFTMTDSQVYGNTSDARGGGVALFGPPGITATILRTDFERNGPWRPADFVLPDRTPTAGGGLFTEVPTILDDATFFQNSGFDGGAISAVGDVSVSDTLFEDNRAWDRGGAVHTDGGTFTVEFSELSFNSAHSPSEVGSLAGTGGAIALGSGFLGVTDSTLVGNFARDGGAVGQLTASPIGTFDLRRSSMLENVADRHGGAYHREAGPDAGAFTVAVMENVLMDGNSASSGSGGAVHNASFEVLELTHTSLANNTAGTDAHLHAAQPDRIRISNSVIDDATASDCSNISSADNNILMASSTCTFSTAGADVSSLDPILEEFSRPIGSGQTGRFAEFGSGALDLVPSTRCSLLDQRGVERSGASCDAGAVESGFLVNTASDEPDARPDGICDHDLVAEGAQCSLRAAIDEAKAQTGFGGIDILPVNDPWRLNLGSRFTVSDGDGFVIATRGPEDLSVKAVISQTSGDTIFSLSTGGHVDIVGVDLSWSGEEDHSQGAIAYVSGSGTTFRAEDATIKNGRATNEGGALHFNGGGAVGELVNVAMVDNVANDVGGAIYVRGADLRIERSTFGRTFEGVDAPNRAVLGGGAIHADTDANVRIIDSIFAANEAGTSVEGSPENRFGGALHVVSNANVSLTDTKFEGNVAGQSFETTVFGYGAAIAVESGTVTNRPVRSSFPKGTEFFENDASNGAGADVYNVDGFVQLSHILSNAAVSDFGGGSMRQVGLGTLAISDSLISDADSGDGVGGALWASAGAVALMRTSFESNETTNHGGAINLSGTVDPRNLEYLTFEQNVAGGSGGAVHTTAPATWIGFSNFFGNTASDRGGAIHLDDGATGSHLQSNRIGRPEGGNAAPIGGGVAIETDATLNLNIVEGNGEPFNTTRGAGIDIDAASGTVVVVGGSVIRNEGFAGAGISIRNDAFVEIAAVDVSDNHVRNEGSTGGGLDISGTSVLVRDLTIAGNTASDDTGGGAYVWSPPGSSVNFRDVELTGNSAGQAGALRVEADSPFAWIGGGADGNATSNGANVHVTSNGSPGLPPVTFTELTLSNHLDPLLHADRAVEIVDSLVEDNSSGGLRFNPTLESSVIRGSTIRDNGDPESTVNGSIHVIDAPVDVVSSTIHNNTADGAGSGILIEGARPLTVQNVTIVANTGTAIDASGATGTVTVDRSILEGNSAGGCAGTINAGYTLFGGPVTGCAINPFAPNYIGETADLEAVPTDNGGPTPTLMFQSVSAAVDASPVGGGCPAVDQRGLPTGVNGACDLGAVEAQLGEVALPSLAIDIVADQPSVTPGASIVPTDRIRARDLRAAALTQSELLEAPISAIPISAIPISAIPISAIPISAIDLSLPGVRAALSATPVNELGLSGPIGQNGEIESVGDLLALSENDNDVRPRQSITMADLLDDPGIAPVLRAAPISAIDFGETPISAIPISAIPISAIPISAIDWATVLDDQTTTDPVTALCNLFAAHNFDCAQLGAAPGDATMLDATIAGAPISAIPISAIPISAIPIAAIPISAIPISAINLAASPISAIPISAIPISAIEIDGTPISAIPISAIELQGAPISAIPISAIPISAIPISAIPISAIPISAINVAGSPISAIPISAIPISAIDPQSSPISAIPISAIPIAAIPISAIPISAIPISASDVEASPISAIPISAIAPEIRPLVLQCALVNCDDPGSTTLGEAGDLDELRPEALLSLLAAVLTDPAHGLILHDIIGFADRGRPEVQAALDDTRTGDLGSYGTALFEDLLGLTGLDLATTPLQTILPGLELDIAGLRQLLDNINTDASDDVRSELDDLGLGDLFDLGGLVIIDLVDVLGDTLFAQLLELIHDAPVGDEHSVLDLILALLPSERVPWTELDLADGGIQRAVAGTTGTEITFTVTATFAGQDATKPFEIDVVLPGGAILATENAALTEVGGIQPVQIRSTRVGNVDRFTIPPQPDGSIELEITAAAPLALGQNMTGVTVRHTDLGESVGATAVNVIEEFEPNNTVAEAANSPELDGNIVVLSHIGVPGDVDLYPVDLAAGEGFSAFLGNVPTGVDLDLVLYGPPGTAIPGPRVESVDGGGGTSQVAQDVMLLADRPALQVSANRGRATERVDLPPVQFPGTYLVQVTGYNETTAAPPYSLQATVTPAPVLPPCAPWPTGLTTTAAASAPPATTADAETNTLFLVNRARYAGEFGQAELDVLDGLLTQMSALDGTGADPAVNGHVLALDDIPAVAAAFAGWDADRCSVPAANVVASAIRSEILALRNSSAPNIQHVVVIGPDEQVPFARVPDFTDIANERTFAENQVGRLGGARVSNELHAALAFGYYLTDNAYGARQSEVALNRPIHVPDIAVGRLVETSGEIHAQLQQFLAFDGRLDPATESFVAGYDFLADGAQAVADRVADNGSTVDTLINETWNAGEIRDRVATGQGTQDLLSLNAHFDETSLLSAIEDAQGTQADLFDASEVSGDYAGAIAFTMGCHSALSVSDISIGQTPDWAQAWSQHGASYVGNTGFGYGETETIALSEALMVGFAERLDGSMTIGQALAFAKSQYASNLASYGIYDEKVLMEATFYGLPMYVIAAQGEPLPVPPARELTSTFGLPTATEFDLDPITTPIVSRTNGDGETFMVVAPGGVEQIPQVTHERPIQPRWTTDVTAHDGAGGVAFRATGAVIEDLVTVDTTVIDPVVSRPVVDAANESPEPKFTDGMFPSVFTRVSGAQTPVGPRDQLVVVPGQFRGSERSGVQTLFREMDLTVYYANPGDLDRDAPRIVAAKAVVSGNVVAFRVDAFDEVSALRRVVVLWSEHDSDEWQPLDLAPATSPVSAERWTGGTQLTAPPGIGEHVSWIVQVVDGAGNVGVSSAKAEFHAAPVTEPIAPPTGGGDERTPGTPAASGAPKVGEWFTGPVTVEIDGDPNGNAVLFVNGVQTSSPATINVTGTHQIDVVDEGTTTTRFVLVDVDAPEIKIDRPVDGGLYPVGTGVPVDVTTRDAGSGVDPASTSGHPTSVSMASAGPGSLTLSVTDRVGLSASATSSWNAVTVAAPASVAAGEPFDLLVTGLDDASGLTVSWGDGAGPVSPSSADVSIGTNELRIRHSYADAGTFRPVIHRAGTRVAGPMIDVTAFTRDGRVTGKGETTAPAGSRVDKPARTGKIVVKIDGRWKEQHGHMRLDGKLQVDLRKLGLGKFDAKSSDLYDLVFSGDSATMYGIGKLNGRRGYRFEVRVRDGDLSDPSGEPDLVRVIIRSMQTGAVVFDNGLDNDPGTIVTKHDLRIIPHR